MVTGIEVKTSTKMNSDCNDCQIYVSINPNINVSSQDICSEICIIVNVVLLCLHTRTQGQRGEKIYGDGYKCETKRLGTVKIQWTMFKLFGCESSQISHNVH